MIFRVGRYITLGDVKKMYTTVSLQREEGFTQMFMWHDIDPNKEPDTYQVFLNYMGVTNQSHIKESLG